MSQKDIFIKKEGNNWFQRNQEVISERDYSNDTVCLMIQENYPNQSMKILEVGCSSGQRLNYLAGLGYPVCGIEPSELAVIEARKNGLNVYQGTADNLNLDNDSVDILIFGFCLYLVDPSDYFKVVSEAYRVLADNGVIIIHDFAPKVHYKNAYKHFEGVNSYKFDFAQILLTHPHLVLRNKIMELHSKLTSDVSNQDEWVQISTISKHKSLF